MTEITNALFLFAHGAGADKNSGWMLDMDRRLSEQGLEVVRFNFPYTDKWLEDGKRRPPDRAPKLLGCFSQNIQRLLDDPENKHKQLFIGGKSMGGRMASLLAADPVFQLDVAGVICMGYPFHPPKKIDKFKGTHLATLKTPTLILQGERDTMGSQSEVVDYQLAPSIQIHFLPDGDHSFKPRVKSGFTNEENLQAVIKHTLDFIRENSL
jgi:uncharacterized protein